MIDGTGRPPLDQATILIVNGRIESVGTGAAVKIPSGATRVNLAGKTVMPGMINAHGHSNNGDNKLLLHDQLTQQSGCRCFVHRRAHGMTPMQVLVAATSGAAAAMELDQLGAIQPGKQADLLVLNADPLSDIKNTRQIHSVWVGGRRLAAIVGTN